MSSDVEQSSLLQDESEEEFDWEEVEVPEHQPEHLEITLQVHPKTSSSKTGNKKKGINHAERLIRIDCHKIHTVALIASTRQRNWWLNDPLLHARLLSLTPLHLQTAFAVIHKSRVPDQNQRGRMFERAIEGLTDWWANSFFEVIPDGHVRNRTFDEIQQKLEIRGLHIKDEDDPDATLDVETLRDLVEDEVETIRSSKSLMKHALMQNGSRDTSSQLFTALCRGLGIPARLVVSVQSVPWQASVGKPKPRYEKKLKLKGKEVLVQESEAGDASSSSKWDQMSDTGRRLDDGPVPMSEKAKGKQKAKPAVKLRKTKSKGNVLGKATVPVRLASPDPLTTPPVYWTEVFSRPDSRWLPVDPIRGIVNKRKSFDPTQSTGSVNTSSSVPSYTSNLANNRRMPNTKVENRMVYVVAFEEDGYARDVTRRYAREFGAKVAKVQGGSNAPNLAGGGKGRQAWWEKVVKSIERPYRLNRDDLEDQELQVAQMMEGMPSTMTGFKDHPLYVLTRHLKQTETIHPPPPTTPELGKFRGEPVYPRSSVVSLKTAENWMRNTGRSVKSGEQPMKMVKVRAGTVNRMRELEVLKDELNVAGQDGPNGEGSSTLVDEIMQGLYAFSQTEPYVPEPVVNGKIPKNNFGNIDLYVPSMLPKGAVHIPFKGVAKIARKLGFDFAEAVTGFEFKKRRAFPIVEGVVVATDNEAAVLEAYWEAEREAEEKARLKREDRVLKHWTRLVHGLRIRQRLQEQYSTKPAEPKDLSQKTKRHGLDNENESTEGLPHDDPSDSAGGFLAGADRVVLAFHLPKNTHVVLPSLPPQNVPIIGEELEETNIDVPDFATYDLDTMDVDSELEEGIPSSNAATHHIPKTMQQIAEDAAAKQQAVAVPDATDEEVIMTSPLVADRPAAKKATVKISLPSKDSTPNDLSNRGTPSSTRTKTNSKSSTTKRTAARKSKRKRTGKNASELDSGDLSDEEGEEEEKEEHKPSPSKRSRVKATPVATPPATRTLRPRTSKTPAQLAEERQIEAAYRKAVAG